MIKERYITRTIRTVAVTVNGANLRNNPPTIEKKTYMISGEYSDADYLVYIRDKDSQYVPVQIVEKKVTEHLYKIKESVFLQYAELVQE